MPGALRVPELARLLASGGDERITLDAQTGLNRYHSGPYPRAVQAYASSTSNDISPAAFAHVARLAASPEGTYPERLERLRGRIRRAYRLPDECEIVFAPSGTDLEYVALAAFAAQAPGGIHNVLLGADEVGRGCRLSAHGRFHALTTARGIATTLGEPVAGLENVSLVDVPVRCAKGLARGIDAVADIVVAVEAARAMGRHPLVHVVHGSKTGMILPELSDIDRLAAAEGESMSLVVDACQARVTTEALHAYLDRGAIVLLTGSKFMGGPPFSGFAFIPPGVARKPAPLAEGLATIFRRGEWPHGWPGAELLPDSGNLGLLLRLEASIFELERFQRLSSEAVERVILAFHAAVRSEIIEPTPAHRLAPYPPGDREEADTHPIEMRTLSTLDLSEFGGGATFEDAQAWHKKLLGHGVRLGQPVKCVRLGDGSWGATLRVGLAMWQIVDRSGLADEALARSFTDDMARIREALVTVAAE